MTVRRHAFVAHQRTEAPIVQALRVALLETGWRLNDVIPYVHGWEALAADAIDEADAFIMLATPTSLESEPCLIEWEKAVELDKPIIRLDVGARWEHLVPDHLAAHLSLIVNGPPEQYVQEVARTLTEASDRPRW